MNKLSLIFLIFAVNSIYTADQSESGFSQEFLDLVQQNAYKKNEKMLPLFSKNDENMRRFDCPGFASTNPKPTSVHRIRPNDIDVIGAIGDSLTAANGAKATLITGLLTEERGISWSIGAENKNLEKLVTLPNILRKFNPNLYGYSVGSGKVESANSVFNLAHPGDTSFDMLQQAKDLVERMKTNNVIDFKNSWKLVTFFIGGNDLCKSCKDIKLTGENFVKNIKETLDYMHLNLPRTLVNMVLTLDVTGIDVLTGFTCRNMQTALCSCGLKNGYRNQINAMTKIMQQGVEDLVNSGIYDTHNFTVVIQPFMKLMTPPKKTDGSSDYSYFAPDCFHFSARGHAAAAVELWKSMITPVGQKD